MPEITEWARDVLLNRGALVEMQGDGALRALLPADLSSALGVGEWLSLNFGSSAGADDPAEWLDRLGGLLAAHIRVLGARLRASTVIPIIDTEAVLGREFIVQNGIYRYVEDFSGSADYFVFTFQYTVESDERSIGFLTVGLNWTARSWLSGPETLLSSLRDDLEDNPMFQVPVEELGRAYLAAARAAEAEVRRLLVGLEGSANRRLSRDSERVQSYYAGLLEQIQKRIARRRDDAEAVEKERSRARATELDRAAKIEDLRRKYSLRVRIEPTDILMLRLPARQISVRLMRKKEERPHTLHWNPVLRRLELPLCEKCCTEAYPLYLCERVHCLCKTCWTACPRCGKFFCPVCQPRCKCEKAAVN